MKIVFLSYLNRSGSTFLLNQLSKFSDICTCPEADILYELLLIHPERRIKAQDIGKWSELLMKDHKFQDWKLPLNSLINDSLIGKTQIETFIQILITFQKIHFATCNTIVFKQNYLYKLYSKLKNGQEFTLYWISLLRDPRAIFESQKNTIGPQTGKSMCNNPLLLTARVNAYFEELKQMSSGQNRHLIIKYEELISDFSLRMNDILSFLGLPKFPSNFSSRKSQYNAWLSPQYQIIHPNIEQPPLTSQINAWQLNHMKVEIDLIRKNICFNEYYPIQNIKSVYAFNLVRLSLKHSISKYSFLLIERLRRMYFKIRYYAY